MLVQARNPANGMPIAMSDVDIIAQAEGRRPWRTGPHGFLPEEPEEPEPGEQGVEHDQRAHACLVYSAENSTIGGT